MNFKINPLKFAVVSLCSVTLSALVGCNTPDTADKATTQTTKTNNEETVTKVEQPAKKVLVIGIDGLMYDYIDEIDNPLISEPQLAYFPRLTLSKAFNGGYLGTHSHQASYSGPSWSSILTGQWIDGHGVAANNNQAVQGRSIFEHLYNEDNRIDMASYVAWSPINIGHVKKAMPYIKQHIEGHERPKDSSVDNFITNKLVTELTDPDSNLDFIFTHLDEVDGAGHACGWCERYEQTLKDTDERLGQILDAIEERETNFNEQWLVLLVSDHGHRPKGGHGGDSIAERTSLIGTNKPKLMNELFANNDVQINLADEAQNTLMGYPGITAIAPTVLSYLGYQMKPEQQFASPSLIGEVGVKKTYILIKQQRSDEATITINWRVSAVVDTVTLYRGNEKIAELAASDETYDDQVSIETIGKGDKREIYTVVPNKGNSLTAVANFSLGDEASIGAIVSKALLHSAFNGQITPFKHIANNQQQVKFEAGPFNKAQAVNINRQNGYLSAPTALASKLQGSFGFWLKVNGDISRDPNVLSNKNWQSGSNPGFTVSITNSTMKFNVGDGDNRADISLPYVRNQWMFVVAAYDLVNSEISLYINDETLGFQQAKMTDVNVKSITSKLPVNIGEGGDGKYNANTKIDISIADLLIFNHALTSNEAQTLSNIQQRIQL